MNSVDFNRTRKEQQFRIRYGNFLVNARTGEFFKYGHSNHSINSLFQPIESLALLSNGSMLSFAARFETPLSIQSIYRSLSIISVSLCLCLCPSLSLSFFPLPLSLSILFPLHLLFPHFYVPSFPSYFLFVSSVIFVAFFIFVFLSSPPPPSLYLLLSLQLFYFFFPVISVSLFFFFCSN